MSSNRFGAAATFKKEAPMAMYFHCAMHCLNLSASRTISIPAIQQAQAVIKDIPACFRSSAKRTDLLESCINQDDNAK